MLAYTLPCLKSQALYHHNNNNNDPFAARTLYQGGCNSARKQREDSGYILEKSIITLCLSTILTDRIVSQSVSLVPFP